MIVGISPTLHPNHDYARCQRRTANPCVEGSVIVFDSYNDHEPNGDVADDNIAFIFFGGREEDKLHIFVDDKCITPNRTIRVKLNSAFVDAEHDYGYTIDDNDISVRVKGNDETNAVGCPSLSPSLSLNPNPSLNLNPNLSPNLSRPRGQRSVWIQTVY